MQSLDGLRVLVVEDEAMISLTLQDMLKDMGCEIVGAAASLSAAVALARTAPCDVALLDLNIKGDRVDPVADVLAGRGIPFIFATGYGADGIGAKHGAVALLEKPYGPDGLTDALNRAAAACHRET